MLFKNFTENDLKDVIASLFNLEKFKAIGIYSQMNSDMELGDVINDLMSLNEIIHEKLSKDESFINQFAPQKCCKNCLGINCTTRRNIRNWFNKSNGKFLGYDCYSFIDKNQYMAEAEKKQCWELTVRHSIVSQGVPTTHIKIYHLENGFLRICKEKRLSRNGQVTHNNSKIVNIDRDRFFNYIVKRIRLNINCSVSEPDYELIINKILPLENESYNDYFNRCQKQIREKNIERITNLYKMSYDEACSFIALRFSNTEKRLLQHCNFEEVLQMLYPNKNVYDIVLFLQNVEEKYGNVK